ncbi:MAG: hypothetical protein ACK528_00655 [Alphaproteobacteria bacterium]|jgi:hypothetical protein
MTTPDDVRCLGLWTEDPHWGRLYKSECYDCARRVYAAVRDMKLIQPWDGHGPCPDWISDEKLP